MSNMNNTYVTKYVDTDSHLGDSSVFTLCAIHTTTFLGICSEINCIDKLQNWFYEISPQKNLHSGLTSRKCSMIIFLRISK